MLMYVGVGSKARVPLASQSTWTLSLRDLVIIGQKNTAAIDGKHISLCPFGLLGSPVHSCALFTTIRGTHLCQSSFAMSDGSHVCLHGGPLELYGSSFKRRESAAG